MTINVLQLTDLHLFADPAQQLKDFNTEKSFSQVLETVATDEKNPDLVLLTGDLAQLGETVAYQRLLTHCQQFNCPVYAIPGNHDDVDVQQRVFANSHISMQKSFLYQGWHFILLNSVLPKHAEGVLSSSELNFLHTALSQYPEKPTLITLHHHVQLVQGNMDTMMLTNANEFLDIISRHKNVAVVLCGHVHQEFDQIINDIRYLASPSTCLQIKQGTAEFITGEKAKPGYRWLELHETGTLDTAVRRVK